MPVKSIRDAIAGVLVDNPRKSPRVLARLIEERLDEGGWLDDTPQIEYVIPDKLPEPPSWARFAPRLIDDGVATTRNRTDVALECLGLEPAEVRAVVIERDFLRIYRWTDQTELAQTMPILGDT